MQRGFTIGEWIAGTAIVLLIAAILLPVFYGTHDHSPRLSCLHNELQLGLALFQYSDNNDGLLPPMPHDVKNTWRTAVFNQLATESIYKCPEDNREKPGPDGHFQSYALNIRAVLPKPGAKAEPLTSAPHLASLVLLCEVQTTDDAYFDIDDTVRVSPDKHILAVRHSGGDNYLLADGHAKWFKPSSFTDAPPTIRTHGQAIVRWHRDPHHSLSQNALATLADAQVRAH